LLTATPFAHAQSSLSIPRPDPEFKGKIGETLKDSTPSYPPPLKAPQGAPNVLVICSTMWALDTQARSADRSLPRRSNDWRRMG